MRVVGVGGKEREYGGMKVDSGGGYDEGHASASYAELVSSIDL